MRDLRPLPHSNGEVSTSSPFRRFAAKAAVDDGVRSLIELVAHDPSARDRGFSRLRENSPAGTSPFESGGMHDEVRSLRRWGRMAGPEAHDHIDHIRGHIDHTD